MFAELKMFALLLAVVWILPINSMDISVGTPGPCPANIVTMQDLNMEQYAGHWNEHSGYISLRCANHDIKLLSNGSVSISVAVTFTISPDSRISLSGIGNVTSPGKLKVVSDFAPDADASDYWILGTDYENYAVTYCCYEMTKDHSIHLSIWMRQQTLSEEAIRAAHAVLLNNALSLDLLSVSDRTNCD